jgi:cyclic-di-GMP-binding protein
MSVTPPPTRFDGSAPFADARGCREWLGTLPLTNVAHAQALLAEGLRALDAGPMDGLELLKCLELAREKVAFLQEAHRSRYFGKTLPLAAHDQSAWAAGRGLLQEMEGGYRRVLAMAAAPGELQRHTALVCQRIVRFLGAQMQIHGVVYRRFEPDLWTRLHGQYAGAERAGIAAERVKDSLEAEDGTSSVAEAYVRVVLRQAACGAELTAPQMEFVDALLRLWSRRVTLRAEAAAADAALLPLTVDFDKPIGARPLPRGELQPRHRVLDVEQLSRSLRKRVHGLQQDQDPVALGLPADLPAPEALDHLKRLHRLWCEGAPPRPPSKVPGEKMAGLVFGLGDIHFFVSGGKAFQQPDRKRELTRQEKQDIEVFGQVSARTQSMMVSEHSFAVEPWPVIDEMLGAWRVQRPPGSAKGVAIGRLVAMRVGDAAPFFLGRVSALSQEIDGPIVATLTLFPGRPEPIAVRPADPRQRATLQWTPAFRLPAMEKLRIPATLVVAGGLAVRGRGVEVIEAGERRESTVHEVLDHGTDFDRITVF